MGNVALMGWDAAARVWRKVLVNAEGKLIIDPSEIFEDPPTDGEAGKAPTSNWAYDHKADAAAHHAKYTDAEALAARGNNALTLTTGTYTDQDVAGKGMLLLNTVDGNIDLKGLSGGVIGQIIYACKYTKENVLSVYHVSADASVGDRIVTATGATDQIPANRRGGFCLMYKGTYWFVSRHLDI